MRSNDLMSVDLSLLGQATDYPRHYTPQILFPIARAPSRQRFADIAGVSQGTDWWHLFEVSWLNPQGIAQVAMVRLAIPADSLYIVESKSLKLYCNSLNFTEFASSDTVVHTITRDVSECVQAPVTATLFSVDDVQALAIAHPDGQLLDYALDGFGKTVACSDIDTGLLGIAQNAEASHPIRQVYYSHLLRSNCPVTNQPDWGTVCIDITAAKIDEAGLLRYILSYREHNGFHEQCVEQIFADLTRAFAPTQLMCRAWYTRRGGIDINPCRVSDMRLMPLPSRLSRQ